MKTTELKRLGFTKFLTHDEVYEEQTGRPSYFYEREFPSLNVGVYIDRDDHTIIMAYIENWRVIRNIQNKNLRKLLDCLEDADKAMSELKDIETLFAPLFARWEPCENEIENENFKLN